MSILRISTKFDSENGEIRQIENMRGQSERNQTFMNYLNRMKVWEVFFFFFFFFFFFPQFLVFFLFIQRNFFFQFFLKFNFFIQLKFIQPNSNNNIKNYKKNIFLFKKKTEKKKKRERYEGVARPPLTSFQAQAIFGGG
jgi:hypothetical protein